MRISFTRGKAVVNNEGKCRLFAILLAVSTCAVSESFPTAESLTAAVRTVGAEHDAAINFMRSGVRSALTTFTEHQWNVGNATCRVPSGTAPDEALVREIVDAIVKTDVRFYSPPPKEYTATLVVFEAALRACQATVALR